MDKILTWLGVLLKERFGHCFSVKKNNNGIIIHYLDSADYIFFDKIDPIFSQNNSDFPCYIWKASSEGFQGIIDNNLFMPSSLPKIDKLVNFVSFGAVVHYDILGLSYWMMNRIEEINRTDLDRHCRFPATSSHAYKHGYLNRPIIDEWLDILSQIVSRVWPYLELRQHQFSMKVSHDVDFPSAYTFKSWFAMPKIMARHLLKEKNLNRMLLAPYIKLKTQDKLHPDDPFNTFEWLMDISERNNLTSAFYFMCGRTDLNRDSDYNIEYPIVRNLLRQIHKRGHEIGLHPSYGTYQSPELIKQEYQKLRNVCQEGKILQNTWGGRMHYLRWQHPVTLISWENAGLAYDSTLGYADMPGFRCGTCHEYPAYDPIRHELLNIRIRPLIAMECSVISPQYMDLGITKQALDHFLDLKKKCHQVKGCFTLLWHNSFFYSKTLFEMYEYIIRN